MGKNLLAKAGLVIPPRADAVKADAGKNDSPRPKTAVGAMAQFTDRQSQAIREAADLKEKMKAFEGSLPLKRLSPSQIVRSKWANRHEESLKGAEFEELRADIQKQGGNVQPIKVRPLGDGTDRYEIIFGHRRHQACTELGLDVLAMIEPMDDLRLFLEMDRENRARKDLRPYEIGVMYSKALDAGLFPSARALAEAIGIDNSQLSKAISLARLPQDVLEAFPSPLDIQYRWVNDLVGAVQRDPDHVLSVARELRTVFKREAASVFARLVAPANKQQPAAPETIKLSGNAHRGAVISFDATKRKVRVDLTNIDAERYQAVKEAIEKLLG